MKIVAKPIDIIAVFSRENRPPMPWKFKVQEDGESVTIKVDKILSIDEREIAGKSSLVYCCQSFFGNMERRYELKYLIDEVKWELYKV